MTGGRKVILRGFGVLYSDPCFGAIFLPRYEFRPLYTTHAVLDHAIWSKDDLPKMRQPSRSNRQACASLLIDLVNWIWRYEAHIAAQLGTEYREQTLLDWDDGSRPIVPAEGFAQAWCDLLLALESKPSLSHLSVRSGL